MFHLPLTPHVLIVDEVPEITRLVSAILGREAYRVTVSGNVQSLEVVRELAPDVIIHDLMFSRNPQRSWQFLHELRADAALAAIPVILCTASAQAQTDPAVAAELARLDVQVVLKPFRLSILLSAVHDALARPGRVLNLAHTGSDPVGMGATPTP